MPTLIKGFQHPLWIRPVEQCILLTKNAILGGKTLHIYHK